METWGGIEYQVEQQARGLVMRGHEVHVMTVGDGDRIETSTHEGVVYHRLGVSEAIPGGRKESMLRSLMAFSRRALKQCRALDPDIVHHHARYPCLLGACLPGNKTHRWKTLYHAHNWKRAEQMNFPRFGRRRAAAMVGVRIDRRIARRMDHVIAISTFMKKRIVETSTIGADKVSVLTNIIDVETFKPGPTRQSRPELVFVGRIAEEKGITVLIEAMPDVVRAVNDAKLTIIGPDKSGTEMGFRLGKCKEMVARLGLTDHVRFAGEVPHGRLPEVYRDARLVVVPSIWGEPCGLVVIEAMACGVPVVGSRVGGIPELIDEGETGLLADPRDSAALARTIIAGLQDEDLQNQAADRGPRIVRQRHTWESVSDRLVGIYEKLLDARGAAGLIDSDRRCGEQGEAT